MSLLDNNDSGRRAVARNVFYLVLKQVMTTALAILFSAALGRTLGVRDFGLYFLVASLSTFAYVLVDWGQQFYVIREVARQPERGSVLLGTALVLRAAGTVLVMVPSGLAAWALGYDAVTRWYLVAFIAVSLPFFLAQGYGMVFRGRDQMDLDAWVTVANKIALVGFALAALALGQQLPGVLVAQALAGIVALALAAPPLSSGYNRSAALLFPDCARSLGGWWCPLYLRGGRKRPTVHRPYNSLQTRHAGRRRLVRCSEEHHGHSIRASTHPRRCIISASRPRGGE